MFRTYDDAKATPPDETGRFHMCPVCGGLSPGTDTEPCSRACDELLHQESAPDDERQVCSVLAG